MRKISLQVFTYILLCALAVLISCQGNSPSNLEIAVAIGGNPDSLDPHKSAGTLTTQITRSIYDTLVEPDLSPLLATQWKVSNNKLTWFFTLRENVVFHNNDAFTADDVVTSINRILDPQTNSPFRDQFSIIKKIEAVNKYEVKFTLYKPYSGLLALLGDGHAVIMPKRLIKENFNFDRNAVGTGPFILNDWVANNSLTLNKNNKYFRTISTNKVSFLIIPDAAAQVQALTRREVNVAAYLVEPEISQLKKLPYIRLLEQRGSTILVLAINMRKQGLSSLAFRRAMAQAVDKKRLLKDAYNGGEEVSTFWANNTPYSTDVPWEYNPQKAKDFFTAYFQSNPNAKPLVISAPTAYPPHVRAAQIYQQMFEEAGLPTTIELVDWATWLSRIYKKADFDLTVIGHTGKIHPDQRLSNFGKGKSYVGYTDRTFVEIVDAARKASLEASYPLYKQALARMAAALPFIFVGENVITIAHGANISNIKIDPVLATFDFRDVIFY